MVLPARYLVELVRRLPPGTVDISVEPLGSMARIAGEDYEYVIHGFPGEHFPPEPAPGAETAVSVERTDLRRLLREVTFATSHDESRPYLTGVALSVKHDCAHAMATDGSILAYGETRVSNPADLAFSVLLPGRTVQELAWLLTDVLADTCEILPLHNQFLFRLGDVSVSSRLLDGASPDFLRLLPREYPSTVQVDRAHFTETSERAALIAQRGAMRLEAPSGLWQPADWEVPGHCGAA